MTNSKGEKFSKRVQETTWRCRKQHPALKVYPSHTKPPVSCSPTRDLPNPFAISL